MRYLGCVFIAIGILSLNTALAEDTQRLDFIYFRPVNPANLTDYDNIANIVKYHGIYTNNHTYSRTYTGLYKPYTPPYLSVLALADNHESLTFYYTANDGKYGNAKIKDLPNGDFIVSYDRLPLKTTQKPLLDSRYIKTFDISGEFIRDTIDDKNPTMLISISGYHALPKVLNFPQGSKCYEWQFHEDTPEFYEFHKRRPNDIVIISDDAVDDYTKDLNIVTHFGNNNQIAIYHSLDEEDRPVNDELTFDYQTIYHHEYYVGGIKFTPKNMRVIDGKTCTYLNPIAADYIEDLLQLYKDDIINIDGMPWNFI